MQVQTYLFFEGRCEEALAFYREALGAEVEVMMRYSESPEPCAEGMSPPGDKIMHASFRVGETVMMASDGRCTGQAAFQGSAQTISVADEAEATRIFGALSEGGSVVMPLGRTFYSPCFGMVTDKFGVMWMVIVPMEM